MRIRARCSSNASAKHAKHLGLLPNMVLFEMLRCLNFSFRLFFLEGEALNSDKGQYMFDSHLLQEIQGFYAFCLKHQQNDTCFQGVFGKFLAT